MKEYFFEERGIYYRANDLQPGRVTLVLIHGLSGSSSAWASYEPAWEKEYNVITPDLRGHGKSRKPSEYDAYGLEKMTDDIAALLDSLDIVSYVALSQSYATLIAVLLVRRRPRGARAAVFMSSVYGIYSIFLTRISRALIHFGASIARPFAYGSAPGRHIDYTNFRHAGDWNIRRILNDIPNTTLHVWLYCLDHAYARDLDPLWGEIKIPSLILHGRRDSISPVRSAFRLSERMPHAKLVVLEHVSHVFPITNPDEAREIIGSYLKETIQDA